MKLTKDMKELIAFLYSRPGMVRYEFSFDKRDNYLSIRIFFNELTYWTITFKEDGICHVREWSTSKSYYHPSPRVGFLGRYLKKYRNGGNYLVEIALSDLIRVLDKIDTSRGFNTTPDRETYSPWRGVRRATVRF